MGLHAPIVNKIRPTSLIRSIILLPGTTLIFIPGLILWITKDASFAASFASPSQLKFWLGILFLISGLILAVWTVKLQLSIGQGTPAPWDPPRKLVIRGPYRHLRNPMISGAILILLAEALLLQSWPIAIWMTIFMISNFAYIPLVEEKDLENRFGEPYLHYKDEVPPWIPKLRPWIQESEKR
jgi:protein-S-isoprenylcysteine O-methyltransferase Ste14